MGGSLTTFNFSLKVIVYRHAQILSNFQGMNQWAMGGSSMVMGKA